VFTEPIRSRMSAIQEAIETRSGKYVGFFFFLSQLDTVEVGVRVPDTTIQNKTLLYQETGGAKGHTLRPICVLIPETSLLSTELGRDLRGVGNRCAARPRREH
jgi:hypothetical protein